MVILGGLVPAAIDVLNLLNDIAHSYSDVATISFPCY